MNSRYILSSMGGVPKSDLLFGDISQFAGVITKMPTLDPHSIDSNDRLGYCQSGRTNLIGKFRL
jgi:hypothetical protein